MVPGSFILECTDLCYSGCLYLYPASQGLFSCLTFSVELRKESEWSGKAPGRRGRWWGGGQSGADMGGRSSSSMSPSTSWSLPGNSQEPGGDTHSLAAAPHLPLGTASSSSPTLPPACGMYPREKTRTWWAHWGHWLPSLLWSRWSVCLNHTYCVCVGGGGQLALQKQKSAPKGKDAPRKDMNTGRSNTVQILIYFKTTSPERQETWDGVQGLLSPVETCTCYKNLVELSKSRPPLTTAWWLSKVATMEPGGHIKTQLEWLRWWPRCPRTAVTTNHKGLA